MKNWYILRGVPYSRRGAVYSLGSPYNLRLFSTVTEIPIDNPSDPGGETDELDHGTIIFDDGLADTPIFDNKGNGKNVKGTTTDFAKILYSIGVPQAGHVYTMQYSTIFSGLSQGGVLAMVGFGFKRNNAYHFTGLRGDGSTGLNAYQAYGNNFSKLQATGFVDGGAATHGTQSGPNWLQIEIHTNGTTYTLRTSADGETWVDEFIGVLPNPISSVTSSTDFGIALYLDGEDIGPFEVDITLWLQTLNFELTLNVVDSADVEGTEVGVLAAVGGDAPHTFSIVA